MLGQYLNTAFGERLRARIAGKCALIALAIALTSSTGLAQVNTWTGLAGDGLWSSAGNWLLGVPNASQTVEIGLITPATYTVVLDVDATVNSLILGILVSPMGTQTLDVGTHSLQLTSGGTIYSSGRMQIGSGSASAKTSSGKRRPVLQLSNYGELEVEGGSLNITIDNFSKVKFKGNCHVYEAFTNEAGAEVQLVGSSLGDGVLNVDNAGLTFDNDGVFIMDSESPSRGAYLNINGAFTNRTGLFTCRDASSQGGARVIDATLINASDFMVTYPLRLEGSDHSHSNTGNILILADFTVQQSGTSPTFTNQSSIELDGGSMSLHGGALNNYAGTIGAVTRKLPLPVNQVLLQNCSIQGSLTNDSLDMVLDDCNIQTYASLTNDATMTIHHTLMVNTMANFVNNAGAHLYLEAASAAPAFLTVNLLSGIWINDGIIHMTSTANDEARITVNGGGMTNNGTIQAEAGAGGLRAITASLNNQGTLSSATNLVINGAGNHTNGSPGIIQVTAGTTQIDLQNSADLFRNDGTISTQAGATFHVLNGHFAATGPMAKRLGSPGLLFLENVTIENTSFTNTGNTALAKSTIDATATITNQGYLYIKGDVPVNGTLTNTGSGTLVIEATATFGAGHLTFPSDWTNSGTLRLTDVDFEDAIIEVDGTLTNDGTIEAQSSSGGDRKIEAELNNQGAIEVSHNLTIHAAADVGHVNDGSIHVLNGFCSVNMSAASQFTNSNTGSIQSDTPGTFQVSGGTFNQSGSLSAKAQLKGGSTNFSFSGLNIDGSLAISSGVNALVHDVTVLNGAGLDNSGNLAVRGTLTCHGSFYNSGVGHVEILSTQNEGAAAVNLDNSVTNDGSMVLNDNFASATYLSCASTFTNNGSLSCQSGMGGTRYLQLVLANGSTGIVETLAPTILEFPTGSATNDGVLDILSNTLSFDMDTTATFTNSGTIHVHPSAVLSAVGPGLFDFDGGTVDDGAVIIGSKGGAPPTIYLDDLNVSGSLTNQFDLYLHGTSWAVGSQLDNHHNVTATGTNTLDGFSNQSGGFLYLTGESVTGNGQLDMPGFDNWGTVTVHSADGVNYCALNLSSMLHNHADATLIFSSVGGSSSHLLVGPLSNDGQCSFQTDTQVHVSDANSANTGLIEIYDNKVVTWQDLITPTPYALISNLGEIRLGNSASLNMVGSVIDNRFQNPDRGLISGDGTIGHGTAALTSHGTIAPGASPGELNLTGNLNLQADGITYVDLWGPNQGTDYDHLVVSGTVNLAGELAIGLDYVPTEGETFTIIEAGSVTGTFATVINADVGNGLVLVPNYTATSVVLEAVAGSTHWINSAGGLWSDPANWNPATVPGPCTFVTIDAPGTYTVQLDQDAEIYNLTLGANTGSQTLDTQGRNLYLHDGSVILPHGVLLLHDSALAEGASTCLALRGQNFLGTAGMTNQGLLIIRGKTEISIPFGNTGLGTLELDPLTGQDATLLFDYQSFLNEGLVELSDSGGTEVAQLRLNSGGMTNNGTLLITPGSSIREIITPLINQNQVQIQGDVMLDPVQIGIRPAVNAFLQPDDETLVRYSMDETEGDQLSDAAALGLDLEAVGEPTQGAFHGGRFLDGIDDELPMEDLRATLLGQPTWTLGWFSRSPDAHTPAMQPLPQFFAAKDRNLADGLWHHFDLAFDGTTLSLYRDGQLSNTLTTDNAAVTIAELRIGFEEGHYVAGTIDDLWIRTDALDEATLAQIADMVAIANDRPRAAQVNDPDGIRQVWIDGRPVAVVGTTKDGLLLFSRQLDPAQASTVAYATHDGQIGRFSQATLEATDEPYTYVLVASREATKGLPQNFNNDGTLAFSGDHELNIPEGVLDNSGTISGNGRITVTNATFQSDGIIAPGASAGALTVDGDLTLLSPSSLHFEIGGAAAGSGYDQLIVTGNIDLAGSMTAGLINSYSPSGGQVFDLVTYASHSGAFANITLPTDTGTIDYQSSTGASSFQVQAVPISTYSFNPLTYSEPESLTAKTASTITIERSGNLTVPGTVTVATVDIGQATANVDYTSLSQVLNFAANQASQTVSVTILDDTLVEGDEDLQLQLSAPTVGSIGNGTATLTIVDVEQGTLALANSTYSVAENGGSVTVTVNRNGGSDGNVSALLTSSNVTATGGLDFSAVNTTLSWADGDSAPKDVIIPMLDDQLLEGDETFTLQLSSPTGGVGLGTPSTAVITITDYEEGEISFSAPTYSVAENGSSASITVERIGGSDGPLSATFFTTDGSATAGADYTSVTQTVSYSDGQSAAQTITVPILDDSTYEGDETVDLSLGPLSKLGTATTAAVLTILEDEQPPGLLDLGAASYTVSEGAGSLTVTVLRSVGSGGTVTVDFQTFDNGGGASAGSDYTAVSTSLSFGPTVTSQSVVIPILEDSAIESGESFGIRIQNPGGGATLGSLTTGSVLIQDNDNPPGTLALVSSTFTVSEGGASLDIGVSRTGGSGGVASVTAATVASGSASAGLDYTASSINLKWADGESETKFLTVPILEDNVAEPTETFAVALTNVVGASLGSASGTVSITDNDSNPAGTIQLSEPTYTVQENGGVLHFQVLRSGGSGGRVSVHLTTVDSSAQAGHDYTALSQTVTFEDFDAEPRTIDLPIIDDSDAEGNETLLIVLSSPTGGATLGSNTSARVTIVDDEGLRVQWTSASQRRAEANQTTLVTASLDSPSANEVRVGVLVQSGGSATEDADYDLPETDLVFEPGSTIATLAIELHDDELVEGDERFALQLRSNYIAIGSPDTMELVIADNDTAQVNWSLVPETAQEGTLTKADHNIAVVASLTHPLERGGSVPLTTAGTASAGVDYIAPEQIVFEPGASSGSAAIAILDDNLAERLETLILTLSAGDMISLGAHRVATVNLQDDDLRRAYVSWTQPNTRVVEDDAKRKRDTAVTVEAFLSTPFDHNVSVNYRVAGLATFAEDHSLSPGTLTFPAGVTTATLSFNVLDDNRQEPDENVAIRLQDGELRPGVRDTHNVVIVDNDKNQVPDTRIEVLAPDTYLAGVLQVESGNPISLLGFGTDPQGDTSFRYQWEICFTGNCPQYEGRTLEQILTTPGTYLVTCFAIDADGNRDPTPAELRVQVRANIPPTVAIVEPVAEAIDIPAGETLTFVGEASDKRKQDLAQTQWYLQGDESNAYTNALTFTRTFDEPGDYTVVFEASDGLASSSDSRAIHVYEGTAPPRVVILSPAPGEVFEVGQPLVCDGNVIGGDGKRDDYDYRWDYGDGTWQQGQTSERSYSDPGTYQIRLFVTDGNGNRLGSQVVQVAIVDPEASPEVTFGFPSGMQVQPGNSKREGACVYLNSIVLDNKGYKDLSFVYDVPGAQLNHETPGLVCFPEEGEYTVSLYAVSPNGVQSNVETRTIVVSTTDDSEYEPNDTIYEASPLLPGNYSNLALDDDDTEDYYRVTLDTPGQRLVVTADILGEGFIQVYNQLGQAVGEAHQISGQGNINLAGLDPGDYYLRIYQPDANKRKALGLSISIGVLNPSLYIPDVRDDSTHTTSIGIVNPTGELVCSEAVGFAADGTIIDEIPFELAPRGRAHFTAEQLFGDLASNVAWIQVDSVGELVGYANTESRDRKELYGISASSQLRSELHVPHIAEKTEQWYTRAALINGSSGAVDVHIDTPGQGADAQLDGAFTKDAFEFKDRLDGINQDSLWASIRDQNAEPNIAGIEVFGTLDGNRVSAGLELADVRRDNPNFTFVSNNLYFTHIARDPALYTGLALVNLGAFEQNVIIHAYRPNGTEVGTGLPKTLSANEKLVVLASALLAEMNTTIQDVDWILVEADADIAGFELFGSVSGKQLAGLEATRGLRESICYPFIDTSTDTRHGVSAVNVNNSAITVNFTLYRNDGMVIGQTTVTLQAHQKFVGQLELMFPGLGSENVPGWLEATSSVTGKPLAGFELYLNGTTGEEMGAIVAE